MIRPMELLSIIIFLASIAFLWTALAAVLWESLGPRRWPLDT